MKNILNILIRSLEGITFGVASLLIAYLMVYYIGGQELFVSTISKLTDATLFQKQLLAVSIAGIVICNLLYFYTKLYAEKDKKPFFTISILPVLTLLVWIVLIFSIQHTHLFDKAIESCLVLVSTILLIVAGAIYFAQKGIEEYLINKKLKEKNR